jgi:serine/arginine repetitive matrix protein 1
MTQGGVVYRGTSISQDVRYTDKQKKELRKLAKISPIFNEPVDMTKVEFDLIKRWVARRVTAVMDGYEDDTLIGYIIAMLEEDIVDPKVMLVNLIPFFQLKGAHQFMKDLWALLVDAQKNVSGIPSQLIEESKALLRQRREDF